jgi:ketosteroid isomerase-like protein
MAEQNQEIFRRILAAFNEGGLEAAVEFFDEDVEVYDPGLPAGTRIRGPEDVLRVIGEMLTGFERMQVTDFELIPIGDRVLALIHTAGHGEGRFGRVDVENRSAHAMTFRDGRITYWRLYDDQKEALADIGLDPSAVRQRKPPEPAT